MPTYTTNYNIPKPVPGADADSWGAALNSGMDIIDTQLAGRVGGASALTTVGSVPFVTASGVLGQSANFRFFNGTGNLVIGTTTDGGFKLDVADSGSSGGLRVWDQRATVGSTSFVVRSGAGQGSNAMTTWQSSGGAIVLMVRDDGVTTTVGNHTAQTRSVRYGTDRLGLVVPPANSTGLTLDVDSTGLVRWNAATGLGAWDLSLSRASAGTLQVGDGGANANGNITAAQYYSSTGFYIGGGGTFSVAGTAMRFRSDSIAAFSSTTNATATLDLSLSRASAGVLQVGDGGANALGTLNVARVNAATNATVPLLIGGTGVLSTLTLRSTSGVGTTGADIVFQTGNNGATEVMRLQNNGNVGIGTPTAGRLLDVRGLSAFSDGTQGLIIGPYTGGSGYGMIYRFGTTPDGGNYVFGANGTETILNNPGRLVFAISGTERARIEGSNFKFGGTADRATTAGTNQVVIYDGTAPVGTLAGGCSFYSTAGEMRVMDGAGNATLLSPHDRLTNEWIYDSTHTPTGRRLKISVEKLLRFVDEHFGLGCILEEDPSETTA